MAHGIFLLIAAGLLASAGAAEAGLVAEVKEHRGSPMIHVNGKPVSPLTFYGWAGSQGVTAVTLGTEWRQYSVTFIAPEDNAGNAGVHFRVGGDGPGTVWVDDVRLCPGEKGAAPAGNCLRQGDFEGTREEVGQAWSFFQAKYAKAEAEWSLDRDTKVAGAQSLRVEIKHPGENVMHLHFHQSGHTVQAGRKYTYSLWMKANRTRQVDFMALHIGEPWTIYGGENSSYAEQVRLARDAGVHLFSFGITMPWPKPGEQPNFSATDAAIQQTLNNDPDALLLPRFGMAPPEWWLKEHPDDRMLFDDGKTEGWCMASEAWRKEMQEHLRALVRHCEAKFGDHMLGYHPCGQHTGEWFYERSWEPRLSDFSPAMDRGFARWAQAKYRTVDALRAAWGGAGATFEGIRVPAKKEQLDATFGLFRDPRRERKTIDYFEYKQLAMEEPLEMMARVIKEETQRKKLVCFFYGYLFDMHGLPMGPQTSGHLAMARLLRCPDVDIVTSPISYLDRELGGAGCFMSAVDSVRRAGKLWLNEDDTRTYLTPKDSGFGRVDTPEGTFQVHRRNFAQMWPRRLACWYMDLGGIGWLNGKEIWESIAPMQRFYREHLDAPARWNPEVALIVDEESAAYTRCSPQLARPLVYQMRSRFFRMGAPFGIYLLSDLVAGRVPPARAYFFANCFHLDAAQRAAIKKATRGKTAVWFYGGGFLNEDASEANIAEMAGMGMARWVPGPGKVTPAGTGFAAGLDGPFGTDAVLDPRWSVAEAGVEVIGRYEGGAVAAAAKRTPEGLRVLLGALDVPAGLLRGILKASGVHLYCESDDVALTDGQFLCLSATHAGKKRLLFPGRRTVLGAYDGKEVARGVDHLDLEMQAGDTATYLLK